MLSSSKKTCCRAQTKLTLLAYNSRGLPESSSIPPWNSLSCGLYLEIKALTFHPLGERVACSWRRSLSVFGMAETWWCHPVGSVLQEGIQEPKAICGFHSPKTRHTLLHTHKICTFKMAYLSVKKAVMTFRHAISFSGSCFSLSEVLGPISEGFDFQHTPHIHTPIHKHKNNPFSFKVSSLVYQIRLFWGAGQ